MDLKTVKCQLRDNQQENIKIRRNLNKYSKSKINGLITQKKCFHTLIINTKW
jgi:hypothetical protein